MDDDRFDAFSRRLASPNTRRSVLKFVAATLFPASVTFSRRPATLAKPNDKVTICTLDGYDPKQLPAPAAEAQVNQGLAVYPIDTDLDFQCGFPCGPQCLSCPQRLPSHVCTKCVNGECVCPDSSIVVMSLQGGFDNPALLAGSKYQIFNYDPSTLTIGNIPMSPIQEVDAITATVEFGPFPGDSSACVREVETPTGYTVLGTSYACLHMGCASPFEFPFYHTP